MIDRNAFWLPLAILAMLAALSFWFEQSIQEADSPFRKSEREPDSIIENFKASSSDEAGIPRYRLTASKLSHYPVNDMTLLEQPQFTHLHAEQGEMIVSSRHASVSAMGEEVVFTDNVSLRRMATAGREALSVRSQSLKVLPDKEQIIAEQPVTIAAPGLQVSAMGMHLSGDTRILKLKGRVTAQFQNARRP
jgi:lipopolysaccharide export system protein LptC